ISPFVFSYLVRALAAGDGQGFLIDLLGKLVRNDLHWTALYWIFSLIFLVMLLVIALVRMPVVKLKEDEKTGTAATYLALLKDRKVILFFLGIVAYVGTEQALANWMSEFLRAYHGLDPAREGAKAVAWFWGLMSLG